MKARNDAWAFTLLELLIAVTITLFIAAMMLSVTSGMLNLWRRTQANHTQATTAKQVFDLLEQDLQSAIYRRDTDRWLAADICDTAADLANHGWLIGPNLMKPANGGSLLALPPAEADGTRLLTNARFGLSGIWLRFIGTNIESGGSLPTLIAYQLARRPITGDAVTTNPAPVRYSLYRTAVSDTDSLTNGYDVTFSGYSSPNNTPSSANSQTNRDARNVMNPSHANLLASNIVDFGVWLYVRNPDGSLQQIYPSASNDKSHQAIGNSTATASRYPQVVDVMVRILTEDGATQLDAIESNRGILRPPAYSTDDAWWWSVVEANSKVYTRRIEIKGGAL